MLALLCALTVFTANAFAATDNKEPSPKTPFTDIGGDPHKEAIEYCYHYGFIQGKSATRFAPNDPLTREQIATIWARSFHLRTQPHAFRDVQKLSENEVENAIIMMYGLKYFNGKSDTLFGRADAMTRGDTAFAIVQTYLPDAVPPDPAEIPPDDADIEISYLDKEGMPRELKKVIAVCEANELFANVFIESENENPRYFQATRSLTRGELCQVFFNLFSKREGFEVPQEQPQTVAGAIKSVGTGGVFTADGVEWLVLDVADADGYALVVTKDVQSNAPWKSGAEDAAGAYTESTLRNRIKTFFAGLGEMKAVALRPVASTFDLRMSPTGVSDTLAGDKETDIAFALGEADVTEYFGSQTERVAKLGEDAAAWWTRSAASSAATLNVRVVSSTGALDTKLCTEQAGVRPALFVSLNQTYAPPQA
jgi:hypothetical protein